MEEPINPQTSHPSEATELERFKREINLAEFAETLGYILDSKESSRSSLVMRREADDDKIIIGTSPQGHGVYFSVRDNTDNGTIIDFIQRREGLNLGQVRQVLRRYTAKPPSFSFPIARPIPIPPDRQGLIAEVLGMQYGTNHPYLIQKRGLKPEIMQDDRFRTQIKTDYRGNAIFPHRDRDGITGYEIKNQGFTGFSQGGEKALWYSENLAAARNVIVTESAIDALSHAQLAGDRELAYISIGGTLSPKQLEMMMALIGKLSVRGAILTIGTDNDEGGERFYLQIRELALNPDEIQREHPKAKDWNDDLRGITLK